MSQQELDVSVRITYKGSKVLDVDQNQFERALAILRADLNVLKIPHPKVENVSFVYPGCIQFYWRTFKGSVLYRNLQVRIHPRDSDLLGVILENLSIKSMTMKEWDMYPFSRHPPGGILTMLPTTHNGYVSHTGTPNPYLREKTGSIHFPESEPSTEIDKEAQRILSDSFRSFHRLGNSNQPSGFHHIPYGSPGSSRQSSLLSPVAVFNDGVPLRSHPQPPSTKVLPSSPTEKVPPPSSVQSTPTVKATPKTPSPPSPPAPNLEDLPTINRLTRELSDIRRDIAAATTKETEIIEHLRRLNAPGLPESSPPTHSSNHVNDFALESRIQTLESELRNERRRRIEIEATLKDIERECREPFVVPKLLQSFVAISKMTGESLQ